MHVQQILNRETSFKSREKIQTAIELVNMDDSQLASLANAISNTNEQRKKQRRNAALLTLALPITDTISKGILTTQGAINAKLPKCNLPARAVVMGRTLAGWTLVLGGIGIYNAIKQGFASESPGLRKFERKHPVQSLLVDLGVILGASALFITNKNAIKKSVLKHFPEAIKNFNDQARTLLISLENSKFNKNILPKLTETISKSGFAPAGKFLARNALWLVFGAGILKLWGDTAKQGRKTEKVYYELKQEQNNAADYVVNTLMQERMVLAQQDMLLASTIDGVMAKQNLANS